MSVIIFRLRAFVVLAAWIPVVHSLAQSRANLLLREGDVTRVECRWERDEALRDVCTATGTHMYTGTISKPNSN